MGSKRRHRLGSRRGIVAAAVLALGILGTACVPIDPVPNAPHCPNEPPNALTSTVVNRANADRQANGLGTLWWTPRLGCLAQDWSAHMAATEQLTHRDLGSLIRSHEFQGYTGLAENIYVGPGFADGNGIHDAWMNSPGHRANILGNFDTIGVGWAVSNDGRIWAAENFGRH
jgi:uncharacterized protein YkwD